MNGRKVVEYPEVHGSIKEMKTQFKEQLKDFEKKAKAGEIICLTDLIGNAEKIYAAQFEKIEKEGRA
jgi:mannose/fructose-specific phosphotransferase system component IIA